MDCIFCKIIAGEIPGRTIFENSLITCFLDIAPVSKGHCLLIPKRHSDDLMGVDNAEATALISGAQMLSKLMQDKLGSTGFNLGLNNGISAGQDVMHVHFHFMPRYEGEGREYIKTSPSQNDLDLLWKQLLS